MSEKSEEGVPAKGLATGFSLTLDERDTERFLRLLSDEGLMRAGFVIHNSNNASVTVELHPNSKSRT